MQAQHTFGLRLGYPNHTVDREEMEWIPWRLIVVVTASVHMFRKLVP